MRSEIQYYTMRNLFYLLALLGAVLLVYHGVQLAQQLSHPFTFIHPGEIKGFEATNPTDDYSQLVLKFQQKIKTYNDRLAKDQNLYFWLSFAVTALTAASTLVSSIQAAKKEPNPNPKTAQTFAVIIACLTFLATLGNFGTSHFNELKTEETKKASDLVTLRNQFYADYNKASATDKPSVIITYEQRLD